jgi:hypothetical protein
VTDHSRDGVEPWSETATARERVRAVVETLHEPRSTNWIAERADASWSTTDDELDALVRQGRLRRVESDDATRYLPDYARLLFDEIRTLIEENSRTELRSELTAITDEIETWQARYGVDTWEELEATLTDGDLSSEQLRERRDVVSFWRENEEDRRLLGHALELYATVESAREETADATDRVTG